MQQAKFDNTKKMPARRPGQTLVKVSLVVVLVAGVGGLFLRLLSRQVFGTEELVPLPTVRLRPDILFSIGPVPVTSTLLSAWLVTLLLVAVLGLALGLELAPLRRLRMAVELVLEYLLELFRGVAGENAPLSTFSFLTTIFLFIIANAWVTLLPVYGPVQFHLSEGPGDAIPLLRGAGTDINMPLALALIAGVFVEVHGLRARGLAYVWEFFPLRSFIRGRILTGLYELYLAILHNITHAARLLSFTFRLFGALTAGELLRLIILFLSPLMLVIPFYGLEILIGLLQAFVFAGLTLVFLKVSESGDLQPGQGESDQ